MNNQTSLRDWGKTGSPSSFQLEDGGSNPPSRIELELVENATHKFNFDQIVKNYHTYKPNTKMVGRRIDWLIKVDGSYIGAIGVGSSIMAIKPRDDFIGWNKEQRLKNLVKTCTNWRYCLTKKTKLSSRILKMFLKEARKEWKKKYGVNLVLIETLVEPPYEGTCYKANGWILVGKTKGLQFEWKNKDDVLPTDKVAQKFMKFGDVKNEDMWKVVVGTTKPKLIFVKPLHRYWKKELMEGGKK
tara:strand:+ start:833 stop:1561 length:729 start_codon:yes stop_codon:yes gene_type:complete